MKKTFAILIAVLLIAFSATPAFAVDSPKPTTANYQITIIPGDGGGEFNFEYKTPVNDDGTQTVHFSADPDDGYKFAGWTFEGDYTLLGDPSNPEIDVLTKGDIKAYPKFVKIGDDNGGSKKSDTTDTKVDTGTKSPKTGYSVYTFAAISVASLAVVGLIILAKKRSSK